MRMRCACLGAHVISQHCCRQDKETRSVAPFSLVCHVLYVHESNVSMYVLL